MVAQAALEVARMENEESRDGAQVDAMTPLLPLAALLLASPAHATTTERAVSPALVCTVSRAISRQLDESQCRAVSDALIVTAEPRTLLAIAVIESGLKIGAESWYTRGGRVVGDFGLLGVHCVLSRKGRCENWPVRGVQPVDTLTTIMRNIEAGAKVLAKKRKTCRRRALDCYRGDATGRLGRTADVAAILAAFGGVEVQARSKRVREIAKRIAAAVRRQREGRS
jgi:hypothetical protein